MAPPPPKTTDTPATAASSEEDSSGTTGASAGSGGGNVINLVTLSPPQLQQLKQQIEQELNFYQDAIVQLKEVQEKMQEAGNCVKALSPNKKELLLPLTPSLYVLGDVESVDNVIIDIGTGYYIEKVEFLTAQIEKVQQVGREKTVIRQAIMETLDAKLKQQISQLNQQSSKSGTGK